MNAFISPSGTKTSMAPSRTRSRMGLFSRHFFLCFRFLLVHKQTQISRRILALSTENGQRQQQHQDDVGKKEDSFHGGLPGFPVEPAMAILIAIHLTHLSPPLQKTGAHTP